MVKIVMESVSSSHTVRGGLEYGVFGLEMECISSHIARAGLEWWITLLKECIGVYFSATLQVVRVELRVTVLLYLHVGVGELEW